jgi:hypothetical protein
VSTSIHSLGPLEIGGVVARRGFAVQDHVAAGYCLDMIRDQSLTQVWCESQDDITLIWINGTTEEVEFIQVKSNELDQLWTIAKLLEKESRTDTKGNPLPSRCILEKSLQFDRCAEPVSFGIVTCVGVKDELEILTYDRVAPIRATSTDGFSKLLKAVTTKVGSVTSPNGNGCAFWIERTRWYVVHSLDAISNANLIKIAELAKSHGQFLAIDQIREIYQKLLTQVHDAGLADWKCEPEKKKFRRADLSTWFADVLTNAVHPALNGTGKALSRKLLEAGLSADAVESAISLRHHYRSSLLAPKYSDPDRRLRIEGEIEAHLLTLRSNLDCGNLADDGPTFHSRCLNEIKALHERMPSKDRPPLQNVVGFMYNLADRCTHRFLKASA